MTSEAAPVIQTHNLTKTYKNTEALSSLDLQVMPHSIFGFLGPNGAGKTTTIKLLLGLVRPTSGSATVFGRDIIEDSVEIRTRVGYLAQEPRYYDHMTARQTLTFTARFFFSGPEHAIKARVNEMLDLVGLSDKADRPIKGFSGGERQRLGIAQAQVNYPDLLILDEPAASLDPMGRRDVLAVMDRLRKHTTIFYSTHILDDVQRVSDSVAILNHGQLVAQGPIETLLNHSGKTTYTVRIKGDATQTRQRIADLAWISSIDETAQADGAQWHISVSDPEAAEALLLRTLLADEHTRVTSFTPRQMNLEEVFLSIVEGADNGQ